MFGFVVLRRSNNGAAINPLGDFYRFFKLKGTVQTAGFATIAPLEKVGLCKNVKSFIVDVIIVPLFHHYIPK